MACALGTEQDCVECRMCGNGKGGKKMKIKLLEGLRYQHTTKMILKNG